MRRAVRKRGAHCKSATRTAKARRALLKRDTQSQCAMRRANARHTERRAVRSKRATSKAKARQAKQKRDAQSQCGTCKAGGRAKQMRDEQGKRATGKATRDAAEQKCALWPPAARLLGCCVLYDSARLRTSSLSLGLCATCCLLDLPSRPDPNKRHIGISECMVTQSKNVSRVSIA